MSENTNTPAPPPVPGVRTTPDGVECDFCGKTPAWPARPGCACCYAARRAFEEGKRP